MSFDNLPPLDLKTFINTVVVIISLGGIIAFWRGVQGIRSSYAINYIRVRRARLVSGWRMILLGIILVFIGLLIKIYGEPVAYRYIPVTPTPTLTPTMTPMPSMTLVPSAMPVIESTLAPDEPVSPEGRQTPHIPMVVEVMFEGEVTPPAESIFSPLTFSHGLDADYIPKDPATEFDNPVGHLYASFSYDNMAPGVQWTALWYRESDLVHYETMVWEQDWGSGGYGYTDWDPAPGEWLSGNYWVEIYVGHEQKAADIFTVFGTPPTPTFAPIQPTVQTTPTYTSTPVP